MPTVKKNVKKSVKKTDKEQKTGQLYYGKNDSTQQVLFATLRHELETETGIVPSDDEMNTACLSMDMAHHNGVVSDNTDSGVWKLFFGEVKTHLITKAAERAEERAEERAAKAATKAATKLENKQLFCAAFDKYVQDEHSSTTVQAHSPNEIMTLFQNSDIRNKQNVVWSGDIWGLMEGNGAAQSIWEGMWALLVKKREFERLLTEKTQERLLAVYGERTPDPVVEEMIKLSGLVLVPDSTPEDIDKIVSTAVLPHYDKANKEAAAQEISVLIAEAVIIVQSTLLQLEHDPRFEGKFNIKDRNKVLRRAKFAEQDQVQPKPKVVKKAKAPQPTDSTEINLDPNTARTGDPVDNDGAAAEADGTSVGPPGPPAGEDPAIEKGVLAMEAAAAPVEPAAAPAEPIEVPIVQPATTAVQPEPTVVLPEPTVVLPEPTVNENTYVTQEEREKIMAEHFPSITPPANPSPNGADAEANWIPLAENTTDVLATPGSPFGGYSSSESDDEDFTRQNPNPNPNQKRERDSISLSQGEKPDLKTHRSEPQENVAKE
jgi:hypothetical protein